MATMLDTIGFLLDQPFRNVPRQLTGLTDEQLNRPLDLPETNTLYQLATHTASAAEFWLLTLVGGRPSTRNREADFHSSGSLADVQRRYAALREATQALLTGLSEVDLVQPLAVPAAIAADPVFREFHGTAPLTVGYALLHVMRHNFLHMGHMQLTIQLLTGDG